MAAEHIGIELRISNINGELVRTDSDQLYWSTTFHQCLSCTPACPPNCERHGWYELIPGKMMPYAYPDDTPVPGRLKIEIRPLRG
ncbi:MAG TPA: hypothetical protein VGR98_28075 [Streptosporangiaceae bacterium]|nr:hypothetical protein [Streptosporangiaceae bacterium]